MEFSHLPVMAGEVVRFLDPRPGGVYVDGTVGGAGHTIEILKAEHRATVIGMDRDADALKAAKKAVEKEGVKDRVKLVKSNFKAIKAVLDSFGVEQVDGIVLDIGVSSFQLDSGLRGFSFRLDARLDMRMDQGQQESAYDLVNGLDEKELARIFKTYGEERFAGKLAAAIVRQRRKHTIETTGELAMLAFETVPKRFHEKGQHPATRIFQALRIAVNDELEGLSRGLSEGYEALKSNGRFVVISFHSLEDRIVKEAFRSWARGCICPPRFPVCVCGNKPKARILTPRPVTAADEEIENNPRARSAKLRAIEKL